MVVEHENFTVNQQESAGCIQHEDYGTTCAVVTTDDTTNGKMGKSYWFPDTASTQNDGISGGTLDIYAETSHLIDSYYGGLDRWQVINVSATKFQSCKFQPKAPTLNSSSTDQTIYNYWSDAKDYRFEDGDEVNIFRM